MYVTRTTQRQARSDSVVLRQMRGGDVLTMLHVQCTSVYESLDAWVCTGPIRFLRYEAWRRYEIVFFVLRFQKGSKKNERRIRFSFLQLGCFGHTAASVGR